MLFNKSFLLFPNFTSFDFKSIKLLSLFSFFSMTSLSVIESFSISNKAFWISISFSFSSRTIPCLAFLLSFSKYFNLSTCEINISSILSKFSLVCSSFLTLCSLMYFCLEIPDASSNNSLLSSLFDDRISSILP